mmetsp:Transcript_6228/g.8037  ORF Transcript_6228/g.8037 Transcript_6228/m.8037 type:complete len:264 (+) Transcript_6228:60-851(+)
MAITPFTRGTRLTLTKTSQHLCTEKERPLVLLSGWMGSTPRHLRRIKEHYENHGYDTYSFSAGPREVVFPKKAIALMEKNMDSVIEEIGDSNRPIIFHGFSMSGFLWGNALLSMDKNPERFGKFKNNLKVQIFDSPPDYVGISGGIAKSMGFGDFRSTIVKNIMDLYLHLTKDSAGVIHLAASNRFHGNDLKHAPSLWMYSLTDPVASSEICQIVANKWRAAGVESEEVVFKDTAHVQHMLKEPEKYISALDQFLQRNGLLLK